MSSPSLSVSGKRKRAKNFTPSEVAVLRQKVEHNIKVIEGRFSDTVTRETIRKVWVDITTDINAVGVSQRTVDEVKEKWRAMKKVAKKDFSKFNIEAKRNGGGPPPEDLSTETHRVIDMYRESAGLKGVPGALQCETIMLPYPGQNDESCSKDFDTELFALEETGFIENSDFHNVPTLTTTSAVSSNQDSTTVLSEPVVNKANQSKKNQNVKELQMQYFQGELRLQKLREEVLNKKIKQIEVETEVYQQFSTILKENKITLNNS